MNNNFAELINSQWFISFFFFIAGSVITIIVTLFSYKLSISNISLSFYSKEYIILRTLLPFLHKNIEVSFKDKKIDNICEGLITIWNSGKKAIRKGDIANENPLKLYFKDEVEILDARIITTVNNSNNCHIIIQDDKEVLIEFDYINPRDGFVIKVNYSLVNELDTISLTQAQVEGSIIGMEQNIINYNSVKGSPKRKVTETIFICLSFLIILSLDMFVLRGITSFFPNMNDSVGILILFVLLLASALAMPKISTIILKDRKIPDKINIMNSIMRLLV